VPHGRNTALLNALGGCSAPMTHQRARCSPFHMSAVHAHILVAVLNVVCVKRRPWWWWWWWGVCACVLGGGGTAGVVEGKQECGVNSLPMHNSDYRVYGIGSAAHRPSRNSLGQTVAPFELHAVAPHRCGSAARSSQRPLASLAGFACRLVCRDACSRSTSPRHIVDSVARCRRNICWNL
jgi:hypothetical protein